MGLETLKHKTEVLERHCEAIGRDPSTIERTMGAPGIVTATDADTNAALERIPPERRPYVNVGPPEKVAEGLRPYIEAGLHGLHVQQQSLPDTGADRPRRRPAEARRERDPGRRTLTAGGRFAVLAGRVPA